jgi:hypothetical protein
MPQTSDPTYDYLKTKIDHQRRRIDELILQKRAIEVESKLNLLEAHDHITELEKKVATLEGENDGLEDQVAELLHNERACPSPGGCRACPQPAWCALNRVKQGMATVDQEMAWLGTHELGVVSE